MRTIFGAVLTNYRTQRGWTQPQAANRLHVSMSLYEKIERGSARPQPAFAADCDGLFEVPGVFAVLQRDTTLRSHPSWFAPRVELEEQADIVTDWVPGTIPGLLQTPAFAHAIVRASGPGLRVRHA